MGCAEMDSVDPSDRLSSLVVGLGASQGRDLVLVFPVSTVSSGAWHPVGAQPASEQRGGQRHDGMNRLWRTTRPPCLPPLGATRKPLCPS